MTEYPVGLNIRENIQFSFFKLLFLKLTEIGWVTAWKGAFTVVTHSLYLNNVGVDTGGPHSVFCGQPRSLVF